MSAIEQKLAALGLVLPAPRSPVADCLGAKRSGALLFVSGLVSTVGGAVATEVAPEAAKLAARETMLDLLALVKREIGDLDLVVSVEQVRGFVRSAQDFATQPRHYRRRLRPAHRALGRGRPSRPHRHRRPPSSPLGPPFNSK